MIGSTTAILAQLDAAPAPLPPGPPLVYFTVENPYPAMVVALVAGAVAAALVHRAGQGRWAALVLALAVVLAGALWLAARATTTIREQINQRSRLLVNAVARLDRSTAEALLADDARMHGFPGDGWDRARMLDEARHYLGERFPIREHDVVQIQAVVDGRDLARSQVLVAVTEASGAPHRSWWRLDWRREAAGWRVFAVELLWLDGFSADRFR